MTASGTLGLYPKFRADDADGLPLEGGRLYSYRSGTSTPQSLYADAELTTALPNPLVLDSSGEAQFYYGPSMYGLTLTDAQDVPLWTIDPVNAGTGGGAAAAGMGLGSNTVELRPGASTAQAAAVVFPASVLALGLTVWISETFGTSQGLAQIGIGTVELPDAWGVLTELTADTATHAGTFLAYSGQPIPNGGTVTLTAYGGRFDGTGAVYLTGHFATFAPSHALGMTWTPPGPPSPSPPDPQPYATEMTPGVVELLDATEVLQDTDTTRALTIGRLVGRSSTETRSGLTRYGTPTETSTGTLTTVATHPAGVKAALDARVPAGTALSVTRYAPGGTTLEDTPNVYTDTNGQLGLGTATPTSALTLQADAALGAQIYATLYQTAAGAATLVLRRARGTQAAPLLVQGGDPCGGLNVFGWARNVGNTADQWTQMLLFRAEVDSVDGSGRIGSRVTLWTMGAGTAALAERLRVDQAGQVGIATTGPTAMLDVNSNTLRLRTARTPASATAAGNAGDICWDANFVYICVATNAWKRAAIAAW